MFDEVAFAITALCLFFVIVMYTVIEGREKAIEMEKRTIDLF